MGDIRVKSNVEVREFKSFTVDAVEVAVNGTSVRCKGVKVARLKSGEYSIRAIGSTDLPWLNQSNTSDTVHVRRTNMLTIVVDNNRVIRGYVDKVYDMLSVAALD